MPFIDGLTFGIELEAVLVISKRVLHREMEDWEESPVKSLIYDQLTKPMRKLCRHEGCTKVHEYTIPVYNPKDYLGKYPEYQKWGPYMDSTVNLTREQQGFPEWQSIRNDYEVFGIEVISRVMNASGDTPDPDGKVDEHGLIRYSVEDEIRHVLDQLNALNMTQYCRCFVNVTSGMHVHIGAGRQSLPVEVGRGLRSLFTAFERQIDTILPTERISAYRGEKMVLPSIAELTPDYQYQHDSGNTFSCQRIAYSHPESSSWLSKLEQNLTWLLQADPPFQSDAVPGIYQFSGPYEVDRVELNNTFTVQDKESCFVNIPKRQFYHRIISREATGAMRTAVQEYHVPAWLYILTHVKNWSGMEQLNTWGIGRYAGVNLSNINEEDKDTIEIRCHPGSLDFEEIMAWVNTLISMTEYILDNTEVTLTKLLMRWSEPSFTFIDLIKAVGVSQQTLHFYRDTFLKDSYAKDRKDRIIARQDPTLPLAPLLEVVEATDRVPTRMQSAVDERIRHKTETGFYGKLPFTLVKDVVGSDLVMEAKDLIILPRNTENLSVNSDENNDDEDTPKKKEKAQKGPDSSDDNSLNEESSETGVSLGGDRDDDSIAREFTAAGFVFGVSSDENSGPSDGDSGPSDDTSTDSNDR